MATSHKVASKEPNLDDLLCFAIYSANLAFGRAYKTILDSLGLTYTQYITVIALWQYDNQTVGSLGNKLSLESNTLTPILKKLEAMGTVRHVMRLGDFHGLDDQFRYTVANVDIFYGNVTHAASLVVLHNGFTCGIKSF